MNNAEFQEMLQRLDEKARADRQTAQDVVGGLEFLKENVGEVFGTRGEDVGRQYVAALRYIAESMKVDDDKDDAPRIRK